ncbi:M50 family metallopeptidase [Alteribacter aurantiacus]|uniref:M50 family metallopeptidase n=1 Tax=Alteribacter aurantiacus TaxID=254410 RepID=UPI00047EE32B|nr:M50 family metallopeptidase [Alteribacter aurantiacus]
MEQEWVYYALLFIAVLVMTYLPGVGVYFRLFNTFIHESVGHALVARMTGGRVVSISLFQNTGGLAVFQHHWFGKVITIFSGYPVSSLMSVVVVYAIMQGLYEYVAVGLFSLLVYGLVFWVRNVAGWFWVLSVIGGISIAYMYLDSLYFEILISTIGLTLLIQAFSSSWGIFILSVISSKRAGDTTLLAEATKIPAVVWGIIFMIQGTVFFLTGVLIWFGYDLLTVMNELIVE